MEIVETDGVLERFALLADAALEQAAKYRPLCADAAAELSRRAVKTDGPAREALCAAAAALAFYRWSLLSAAPFLADEGFVFGRITP